MTTHTQTPQSGPLPREITLLMLLCGLAASGAAVAAQAAAPDPSVPTLTVHFLRPRLATDEGARAVYRSIVRAAETVCPLQSGSPFVSEAIKTCRKEAVARAVHDIGSTRLAALHASSPHRG